MAPSPRTRTAVGTERVARHDLALAAAVALLAQLEVWVPALSSGGGSAQHRAAMAAAALLAGAALVVRRARPLLTLALVMAAVQGQIALAGTESVTGLAAVLLALFAVGSGADRRSALIGLAAAAGWVLLQGDDLADHVFGLLLVGGPWVAGRLIRGRQSLLDELGRRNAELEAEQRKTAVLAVAAERARIARDVHDVVAHGLTVMIVQAQAAEAQLTSPRGDPGQVADALRAVQKAGRSALAETRRVVGELADHATLSPAPTLGDVEDLVQTARDAGVPVALSVTGQRSVVPPAVDLTGYRVVQEALTNVVRHAGQTPVTVCVSYRPGVVEIEVADEGRGLRAGSAGDSSGRGLPGMRDRVESCGGRLTVQAPVHGGFVVGARFPVPDGRSQDEDERVAQ